jgi:hypothetical protein
MIYWGMATNGYKNPNPLVNRYGRPSQIALELAEMRERHSEESAMIRAQLNILAERLQKLNASLDKIETNDDLAKRGRHE